MTPDRIAIAMTHLRSTEKQRICRAHRAGAQRAEALANPRRHRDAGVTLEDVMAERTEREVLHHLIEICQDGERGFRAAADYVQDPSLKAIFNELADQRQQFATDLLPHLHRLGGRIDGGGTGTGALHRGWMNLKGHIPGHSDHAIITEAIRGEQAARAAYDDALAGMVPPTVSDLLEAQREALRKSDDRIRAIGPAV
jgi:uncharacterized protein (TIGR02284 family)